MVTMYTSHSHVISSTSFFYCWSVCVSTVCISVFHCSVPLSALCPFLPCARNRQKPLARYREEAGLSQVNIMTPRQSRWHFLYFAWYA